jgi:hypothetical protein
MQRLTGAIAFALAFVSSLTAFAQTPSTGRDYSDL